MQLAQFMANRKQGTNQYFAAEGGNGKTVLVSSHIYWTDLMGLALLRLGYNVIFSLPLYGFWIDDNWYKDFDNQFGLWVKLLKDQKVVCMIGGNTTGMVLNQRTGEALHRAAGIPAVHFWWDQPRTAPPMARRGVSLKDYVALLKDERTLNVIWDIDVQEELREFLGVGNSVHVPIATTPELWEEPFVAMADRKGAACFLGNCHFVTDEQRAGFEPELAAWAGKVAGEKLKNLDRGIVECVDDRAAARVDVSDEAAIARDFRRWYILDAMLMEGARGAAVTGLAKKLGESFTLIGGGWENVGLKAQKAHSGVPGAKVYYGSHKASVNLYGGCVHGGMPLRPYEIASSNGLLFTHYNRELPDLFEPDKECVAFRNESEMLEKLDRILASPSEYDRVVQAGRRRAFGSHTWENRMERVMREVTERFGV
jgi:hypothetical protein